MSTCGGFPIRTHVNVPGYGGSLRLYLSATKGGRNLPPRKWCGPSNFLAHSFGAIKETLDRETKDCIHYEVKITHHVHRQCFY